MSTNIGPQRKGKPEMNKTLVRQATGLLDRILIGGLLLLVLLLLGLQVADTGDTNTPTIGITQQTTR